MTESKNSWDVDLFKEAEYMRCEKCKNQATINLCESCVHNRNLIFNLQNMIEALWKSSNNFQDECIKQSLEIKNLKSCKDIELKV
jgi:hypothetical protein